MHPLVEAVEGVDGTVALCLYVSLNRIAGILRARLGGQRGQTTLEYFLLVLGVAVLVGDAVFSFGGQVGKSLCNATVVLGGAGSCS